MTHTYIQMPDRVTLDEGSYTDNFGRFTIQPLEKGYAVTLGNSLRRTLLSSISGAAITGVRVEGILHEFTTIPGMVEDAAEFVLNLKEVRIKPGTEKYVNVTIPMKGPAELTAKDLQQNANGAFTILNPDLHLATLNDDCDTELDVRIGTGIGYVPSEELDRSEFPDDMIAIDAVYSPVLNVRYFIEQTRVGQRTDYEKLIVEIETDGSVTPVDAVKNAATILREHVMYFENFSLMPGEEREIEEVDVDPEILRVRKILNLGIDELELSVRSHNCLKAAGIQTVGELVSKTEQELLNYRNFGQKSLTELSELVKNFGLSFGMDVDRYLKVNRK
jgi:DNA-directed RNA polymerase subunit alpha